MSDFAQDIIQKFKTDVLYLGLPEKVRQFNETGDFHQLNVAELLQEIFYDANIVGVESQIKKEKEALYNRYLKKGLLIKHVEVDGVMKLQIELSKK